MIPKDCLYTREHEWLRSEGDEVVVGITEHAAEQLGDVTYVELPDKGQEVDRREPVGSIESVKAVSDVYAPVAGTVTAANTALEADPGLINSSPYGGGWICRMKPSDPAATKDLLDAAAYAALLAESTH